MASLVLGTVGSFIGNAILPGIGGQIGYALGSMVGGALFQETQKYEGQRLNNLNVQSNSNGMPIHKGYGTWRDGGNIIWIGGFTEHKHTETQGGKGGPTAEITNYTYTVSFAVAVNYDEISAIRRVWANKKLGADFALGSVGATGDLAKYMRVYKGDEYQMPDSLIQQYLGSYTPAFRGIAYVVFENLPIEEYGNQLPQLEFEIIRKKGSLASESLSSVIIPKFENSTGIPTDIYENSKNKYLYVFRQETTSISLQKVDQNSMTVVDSAYYSGTQNEFDLRARYPIANDTLGNIYLVSSGSSNQNYTINVIDSQTLINTQYKFQNFSGENDPFKNIKDIYGTFIMYESIFQAGDSNTILSAMTTNSGTMVNMLEFNIVDGLSSRAAKKSLTTSTISSSGTNYHNFSYNKTQNKVFFTSNLDGDDKAPILNSAYILAQDDLSIRENILRLYNDGLSHYILNIKFDEVRNKAYVTSYVGTSFPSSPLNYVDIQKINLDTSSIEASLRVNVVAGAINMFPSYNPSNNTLNFIGSVNGGDTSYVYTIDCSLMTSSNKVILKADLNNSLLLVDNTGAQSTNGTYSSLLGGEVYLTIDSESNSNVLAVNTGSRYGFGTYKLSDLVTEVCQETGLSIEEIDATELQMMEVRGYKRDSQITGRQIIDTLSVFYNFDGVESNGKYKFTLRGKDPVATIQYEELGAKFYSKEYDDSNAFRTQRIQESELPKVLSVLYYDIDKDYEQNTQDSKREINTTSNITTIQAPIVFNSTEAKNVAIRLMYQSYISRDKFQFELNNNYYFLEPNDVIDLIKDNQTYRLRILKIDSSSGILKIEAEAEQKTIYTQNGVGDSGVIANEQVATYADTSLHILDIPIFDLADNNGGNYVVVDKVGSGSWKGAVIFKSLTIDGNYAAQETLIQKSITGSIKSLYDTSPKLMSMDYLSTFEIISTGQLYSITEIELDTGGNICLIGNELIQFMNAELVGIDTYKISGLLRGRFGTEQYIGTHNISSKFILFNFTNSSLARINKSDYIYNTDKFYKGTTIRNNVADSSPITFSSSAVGLKPYAVVNVSAGRNQTGNISIGWMKRIRGQAIFGNTLDQNDPDGDFYEVDIYKDGQVVRTISTTNLSCTYLSTQQVEDFGSVQSGVLVKIYKLSQAIGRGFEFSQVI